MENFLPQKEQILLNPLSLKIHKLDAASSDTHRLMKKEKSENSRWVLWAELMKRVFAADVCVCRNCGGRMELRAVVIRPPATVKVFSSADWRRLGSRSASA